MVGTPHLTNAKVIPNKSGSNKPSYSKSSNQSSSSNNKNYSNPALKNSRYANMTAGTRIIGTKDTQGKPISGSYNQERKAYVTTDNKVYPTSNKDFVPSDVMVSQQMAKQPISSYKAGGYTVKLANSNQPVTQQPVNSTIEQKQETTQSKETFQQGYAKNINPVSISNPTIKTYEENGKVTGYEDTVTKQSVYNTKISKADINYIEQQRSDKKIKEYLDNNKKSKVTIQLEKPTVPKNSMESSVPEFVLQQKLNQDNTYSKIPKDYSLNIIQSGLQDRFLTPLNIKSEEIRNKLARSSGGIDSQALALAGIGIGFAKFWVNVVEHPVDSLIISPFLVIANPVKTLGSMGTQLKDNTADFIGQSLGALSTGKVGEKVTNTVKNVYVSTVSKIKGGSYIEPENVFAKEVLEEEQTFPLTKSTEESLKRFNKNEKVYYNL